MRRHEGRRAIRALPPSTYCYTSLNKLSTVCAGSTYWGTQTLMGELNHECGVAAVFHASGQPVSRLAPVAGDINSVARLVPRMLLDMQNRGQLAAGMSSYHPNRSS